MDDDLGKLGEALVARWLQQQRAAILARRWRCRWGELDVVARDRAGLQFVEVKTRSGGSWDAGGLLAIAPHKQERLYRSALLFLSRHPAWAELPCQFFLARVSGQRHAGKDPRAATGPLEAGNAVAIGEPVWWEGWKLTLQDYRPIEIEIS